MNFHEFTELAVFEQGSPPGTQPNPTGEILKTFGPLAFLCVIFYFILIRPQQKKAKEQAELIKALRPGDKVLTSSGILGVVVGVKDKSVSIRSADAKLEILKSAVTEITERAAGSAES